MLHLPVLLLLLLFLLLPASRLAAAAAAAAAGGTRCCCCCWFWFRPRSASPPLPGEAHETKSALSLPDTVRASDDDDDDGADGSLLPPFPPSLPHLLLRTAAAFAALLSAQPWSAACRCFRQVVAPQLLQSYLFEGPSFSRQWSVGQRALLWTRS